VKRFPVASLRRRGHFAVNSGDLSDTLLIQNAGWNVEWNPMGCRIANGTQLTSPVRHLTQALAEFWVSFRERLKKGLAG